MSKLVLIRHGESQWNLENRFTGWVDVPLSPKGIEEAKAAGKKLAGFTFDRAFSSVLARANETLRLVLEGIGQTGIPIEKDKALNERMYGELQGLNKAETAKKFGDEQVKWEDYLVEMEERRALYAPVGDYEGGAMAASEEISDLLENQCLIQPEDRPKLLVLLPDLVPLDKYQELLSQCV